MDIIQENKNRLALMGGQWRVVVLDSSGEELESVYSNMFHFKDCVERGTYPDTSVPLVLVSVNGLLVFPEMHSVLDLYTYTKSVWDTLDQLI